MKISSTKTHYCCELEKNIVIERSTNENGKSTDRCLYRDECDFFKYGCRNILFSNREDIKINNK